MWHIGIEDLQAQIHYTHWRLCDQVNWELTKVDNRGKEDGR